MLDVSISLGPLLSQAAGRDREKQARDRVWLRKLRAIEARERAFAAESEPKTIIVDKPAHLSGIHRI